MPPPSRRDALVALAWKRGVLAYKLDRNQRRAYDAIRERMRKPFANYLLNWPRRTGKTFLLLVLAIEESIRKPWARVNVAASMQKTLRGIIWPAVHGILKDCPQKLWPHINKQSGTITFPNHSEIVLASCHTSDAVEGLRGTYAHLNIVEEAGTLNADPGLDYLLTSVLAPQLLSTKGATLLATTPPKSPGHAVIGMIEAARAAGDYDHCAVEDSGRYSDADLAGFFAADAKRRGMTIEDYKASAHYRREWLAICEVDPETAVLPGFDEAAQRDIVMDAFPTRPDVRLFADQYEGMDVGWSPDFTGNLFAYWDFERKKLCIEGELLIRRMNTPTLAWEIRRREGFVPTDEDIKLERATDAQRGTYVPGTLGWTRPPYLRVSDVAPQLVYDLSSMHGLRFHMTAKDDRDTAIEEVDVWIRRRQIEINRAGCPNLIAQMKAATHNKHRTDFERSEDFGHFDLVAALVYLVRNVREHSGRIPDGWGFTVNHFRAPSAERRDGSASVVALRKLGAMSGGVR